MKDIAPFVFTVFGVLLAAPFATIFLRSLSHKSWKPVRGWIVYVGVTDGSKVFTGSQMRQTFTPEIMYKYMYANQTFYGHSIHILNYGGSKYRFQAEDYIQEFSAGMRVLVYVDPKHPRRSALFPRTEWYALIVAVFGSAFMCAGLFLVSKTSGLG